MRFDKSLENYARVLRVRKAKVTNHCCIVNRRAITLNKLTENTNLKRNAACFARVHGNTGPYHLNLLHDISSANNKTLGSQR